jgi:hypothetical protein
MIARFLAGLALFLGLLASWPPSAAVAETWQLRYVGMLGQVPLMTAELRAEIAEEGSGVGAFYVTANAGTAGTGAEALFPFQIQFETNGGQRASGLAPVWHRSQSVAWQKQQRIDLDYALNGAVAVFVDPPNRMTQAAIDQGLIAGTIDPVSAAMTLIDQIMRAGACSGAVAVFDGMRRYDLSALESGASVPPARLSGSAGPAHGDAIACRVAVAYRSGQPTSAGQSNFYPNEATIWLAPLTGHDQVVPILAVATLPMGQVRLELLSASNLPD